MGDDLLWEKLRTEANLVVLMRHTREMASADPEGANAFQRKAQSLIDSRRGSSPVVFVSHRPNIELLSLGLIGEGELLVGRSNVKGELDVLGKIEVRP